MLTPGKDSTIFILRLLLSTFKFISQPRKHGSLRFVRNKSKTLKNEKKPGKGTGKAMREWEKKQKKPVYNYFGKPLEDVCDKETLMPSFMMKCLEHIELVGKL